ncbi:MAG: histidine kinase [Chitinophagaceae bacterium]
MNPNRFILTITLLLFCAGLLPAQTKIIDSLRTRIYYAPDEKAKLTAILALCDESQSLDRDTLDLYAYKAWEMAKKLGDKRTEELAAIAMADDYYRWGWLDSALAIITPVISNNNARSPAERQVYFKAARRMAMCYSSKMKFSEALEILYKLVSEAEKYNDTLAISTNLNTIGSIALMRETPATALRWFHQAMSFLTPDPKFNTVRAAVYINLSEGYFLTNKFDSAVFYSEKGTQLFRQQQNLMSLAMALQRQSKVFLKTGNTTGAESALKEMIEVRSVTHDGDMWVDDNTSLVEFYINTNQLDKAIAYCYKFLQRGDLYAPTTEGQMFTNTLSLRLIYYELLAKCYKLKGDTKQYQQLLEQIIEAKDSLSNAQTEQAIAEMQTKYEVQKKENTIIQQRLTIVQKNNTLLFTIGSLVVIMLIVFFLFREYRKKQRLKVTQAIENEKKLAAQAVADAEESERKRIAADLHDNLGAYAASIASNLDVLQTGNSKDQQAIALQELNHNSQTMVAQLSDTIWALNKDSLTLTAISDRIKVLLKRIAKSYTGIEMEVKEDIEEDTELPPTQAFHLFQIIQEAITNAVKHSGTQKLTVFITGGSHWKIAVADNGKGMLHISNTGNGLRNMKERAAVSGWNITWSKTAPQGTTVEIEPVENSL